MHGDALNNNVKSPKTECTQYQSGEKKFYNGAQNGETGKIMGVRLPATPKAKDRFILQGRVSPLGSYALRRTKRPFDDHPLDTSDQTVSLGPGAEGRGTKLYNKLIFTELLKDQEDKSPPASKYCTSIKNVKILDIVARRRSLGMYNCSTSRLSPAGRELINREKSNPYSYSDRAMNVLTARGIMGTKLAVASFYGKITLWDVIERKKIRTLEGHKDRVSALSWNNELLSSGSRDKSIIQHDARIKNSFILRLEGHRGEVCSLKWNCDDRYLASGGNDNKIIIWDKNTFQPYIVLKDCHSAAIKAISWSPKTPHLLASGGGDADRTIKTWNVNTCETVRVVKTDSQVCNLHWTSPVDQLVSSHGYSHNAVAVWKPTTSSFSQVALFAGHTKRALYMTHSPDDSVIVTGSPDETLRFWNVYSPSMSKQKQ